jgi:o-succinylbenzoate synthase
VPAWALLRGAESPPAARRLAALLPTDGEQAWIRARAAHADGLTAFKLKVGRHAALEQELALLERLRSELGEQVDLRLDANQAWTLAQARLNLPRFAQHRPELIEEPCPPAELGALAPSPIRLALDESLLALPADRAALRGLVEQGVSVLVLKPTLLGGISTCCAWAEAARACGVEVILSHTFEGPLGLALCAALALAVGSETAAHGLELHGAGLALGQLPYFSACELQPWSEPGFGVWEPSA